MTNNKTTCLLAGDIGGTKTSLALYDPSRGPLQPLAEKTVRNDTVSGLDEIIASFLQETGIQPYSACFGAAGPVMDNRVRLTNRAWSLDGRELQQRHELEQVVLINDLVATAMGAVNLPAPALRTLNSGQRNPLGAAAVLAPGTGLGEAYLVHSPQGLHPYPSEGGHCLFSPADARQRRLLDFLQQETNPVTMEQVCSGTGIPNLYAFLQTEMAEPVDLAEKLASGGDRTQIISRSALAEIDDNPEAAGLAASTMRLFVDILAAEAANLTLKVLATGGLFIGGGIPPRILPFLVPETFMTTFARGVYQDMLARVPVHIILEPKTALIGAAAYGLKQAAP